MRCSHEPFIRREILLKRGEVFSHSDLNESVRNLRPFGVFSLVAAVPVLTNDPDTVGIFLVTRDLWSLRLESSFQLTGGVLDRFQSQLTERNLFGRGIQALVRYNMQPLFVSTGALFNNRRVMGDTLYKYRQMPFLNEQATMRAIMSLCMVRDHLHVNDQPATVCLLVEVRASFARSRWVLGSTGTMLKLMKRNPSREVGHTPVICIKCVW